MSVVKNPNVFNIIIPIDILSNTDNPFFISSPQAFLLTYDKAPCLKGAVTLGDWGIRGSLQP